MLTYVFAISRLTCLEEHLPLIQLMSTRSDIHVASDIVDRSGLVGGLCCGSSPFSAIAASLSAFAHYAVTRLHLADLRASTSDFVERRFVGRLRDHRIVTRTRTAGGPVDPAPPFIYLRVCLALYFRFELVCPPSIHLAFPHLSPAERRFRRVSPVIVTQARIYPLPTNAPPASSPLHRPRPPATSATSPTRRNPPQSPILPRLPPRTPSPFN